jgi:hypothetical protein
MQRGPKWALLNCWIFIADNDWTVNMIDKKLSGAKQFISSKYEGP